MVVAVRYELEKFGIWGYVDMEERSDYRKLCRLVCDTP
jgi:hypothetical protein